jgi:hypothetical protein
MRNIEPNFNQKSLFAHLLNKELENSKSTLASNIVDKILHMETLGWHIDDNVVQTIDIIIDESYLNMRTQLHELITEVQ